MSVPGDFPFDSESTVQQLIKELELNSTFITSIFNLSDTIIAVLDNSGKITVINNSGCSFFGVQRSELTGKYWKDITVVDESGISWHRNELSDDNGVLCYTIISGSVSGEFRRDNIEKVIYKIQEAANSEGNLDELFKLIHFSIKELMPAENFYIALFDTHRLQITFPYFIDSIDREAPPKRFGKGLTEYVIKTGKSTLVDREMDNKLRQDGETEAHGAQSQIWLGIPLKIKENTIGVMAVQDYTDKNTYGSREKEILEAAAYPISRAIERKKDEEERKNLIKELKELNAAKDKLFSLISHDLRSPFNSLLGFSEILNTEYDTLTADEIKEYLKVIYEASKNLYGMTNNLLQYSRFQMGRIEFQPQRLDLWVIINKCLNLVKGNALKKNISINLNIQEGLQVYADEDMLISILQNLFSNAIKFTHRGGEMSVSAKYLNNENGGETQIAVHDTGVGLNDIELTSIRNSELYTSKGTANENGTGLGLILVKDFIEKHNGRIMFNSVLNKGTSIIFVLPFKQPPAN